MEPHRIKKCIQALNRAVLKTQKKLYDSVVANDHHKQEVLGGVLDELVRRRLTLTHLFLNCREENPPAEEAGTRVHNPAPARAVSPGHLHA